MEQIPSWETNSHLPSQVIHCLLWNPKDHYRVHKNTPLVSMLSHMNPVQNLPTYFFMVYRVIIPPSMHRSSEWSRPFRVFNKHLVCFSHLPHACYMSRPPHTPWFDRPDNIWWSLQVVKLLIMQSSPSSCYFHHPSPNILLSTLFLNTFSLCSYLSVRDQVFHPPNLTYPTLAYPILT
jgi:hypothetical protein